MPTDPPAKGPAAPETRAEAQDRAANAEDRTRSIIDAVEDYAIFMLDAQGRVATWNRGAQKIKGYRPEEIIGKYFAIFYPEDDVRAGKCEMELRVAGETGRFEDENWRIRKDGSRFWANVVISAIRDADGKLLGFAKVTRDLTARKAAEESLRESEARLRALVDSVKDHAIFMLDPHGKIVTWNAGAERIKGYSAAEVVGKHISMFYTPEDQAKRRPEHLLEIAAVEGRVEDEGIRVRKDGTRFWADVVMSAIRDGEGKLTGFSKVTRDLTDRRLAEEERLRLAQAQEAVRLRDEFLSIASHELRTPLTALRLQIQSMRGRLEQLDDKVVTRIDRAERSSQRLSTLVDALLDVSRIATGRFSLTPSKLDLTTLVRDVVDELREQSANAGCEVTVEAAGPTVGTWDRMRIEQVVTNLLTNALKYAAGKPVRFTVGAQAGQAVISIDDGGPGIPAGDLERIFGRFERAASFRHYGGLGLGLYVTREIVAAHGGSVAAENRPDGGARFVVRLPLTSGDFVSPPTEELH